MELPGSLIPFAPHAFVPPASVDVWDLCSPPFGSPYQISLNFTSPLKGTENPLHSTLAILYLRIIPTGDLITSCHYQNSWKQPYEPFTPSPIRTTLVPPRITAAAGHEVSRDLTSSSTVINLPQKKDFISLLLYPFIQRSIIGITLSRIVPISPTAALTV